MQTKVVSFCRVSPVQFAKALCNEKSRQNLRFANQLQRHEDQIKDNQFSVTSDIENQKQAEKKAKKDVWGTFGEGQMIGGIYKLEQDDATFLTLYDNDRYIIVE